MRKKLFILAVSAFLALSNVMAQVKIDRGYGNPKTETDGRLVTKRHGSALAIKYGVKAGVNLSNISNDMTFDPGFSMGTGFQIGALMNFHWGQRTASSLPGTGLWGLQPEVLYSYQAIKSDGGDIKQDLIGFRDKLLLEKQMRMEDEQKKLVTKARLSFNILMIVLVQAILSAMAIYLPDLTNVGSFL